MLLTEIFGTNATLDLSTPSSPKLVITLADLQASPNGDFINAVGLSDVSLINDTNKDEYADKIFTALFLLALQNEPSDNNVETEGFWINPSFSRSFTERNGVSQILFNYAIAFYKSDSVALVTAEEVV
jgi:hypothetical protein